MMMISRIRTIKPEFFLHDGLYDAEAASGLPLRLAFAGLFNVSDREGRFQWKPRQLKLRILPYDNVNMLDVLDALAQAGFIIKYEHDGKDYGYIPTFKIHQSINGKEAQSTLPAPDSGGKPKNETKDLTRDSRVNDASTTRSGSTQGEVEVELELELEQENIRNVSQTTDAQTVFDYYKKALNHPRAVFDDKRKKIIKNALKKYSVEKLCAAINGCKKSQWHMGSNDRKTIYDSIQLIFRNADKIEQFMRIDAASKIATNSQTWRQLAIESNHFAGASKMPNTKLDQSPQLGKMVGEVKHD